MKKLYKEITGKEWRRILGMNDSFDGAILIANLNFSSVFGKVERIARVKRKLSVNGAIVELNGKRIVFYTIFGASMAYQTSYLLSKMRIAPMIFAGTCGSLIERSKPGDLFIVKSSYSEILGGKELVFSSEKLISIIEKKISGYTYYKGNLYTILDILMESGELLARLLKKKFECIDMEYGIIAKNYFESELNHAGILLIWDNILSGPIIIDQEFQKWRNKLKENYRNLINLAFEIVIS